MGDYRGEWLGSIRQNPFFAFFKIVEDLAVEATAGCDYSPDSMFVCCSIWVSTRQCGGENPIMGGTNACYIHPASGWDYYAVR
jgi:hypothetical protein